MASPTAIDTLLVTPLPTWQVARADPDAVKQPTGDVFSALSWSPPAEVGTVAAALRATGEWTEGFPGDLDASDWWFRAVFSTDDPGATDSIRFGGLATLADVWLNGDLILQSENMFTEHRVRIEPRTGDNELVIRFRSVKTWLRARRPRGRWRTRLVGQQQLRWLRTSLLGRVSGWMPPAPPVGPWRPVELLAGAGAVVESVDLGARIQSGEGRVSVRVRVSSAVHGARLFVGERRADLGSTRDQGVTVLLGELSVDAPDLWWPHTHGTPSRYPARIEIDANGHTTTVDLPAVGFRTIDAVTDDGGFQILVNGTPVFCRGGCWTHLDPVGLSENEGACRTVLELARDAGMNMIRVVGTATYESETFYRLCDELGLMVWQDFPFANLDYPGDDEAFRTAVTHEVRQNLSRLKSHPSLTVLCGGSEVQQQAGMLGLDEETWASHLFDELLPTAVTDNDCGVPYVVSSPSGGPLPFHVGTGVAHYFGVGAYRQPLSDARRSGVRFASECLGFANVPEPASVERMAGGGTGLIHTPAWKTRVPRDAGAGWYFEIVRDHYFRELFGLEPMEVRYSDPERYLALSRVASGEVMAATFAEWRRGGSVCHGGLVWFLRDLWLGAGWGVIDSRNVPKACYWFLRRTFAPIAVLLTNEGMDGLRVHVVNETRTSSRAVLEVRLLRESGTGLASGSVDVELPEMSTVIADVDEVLGRFTDATWAYRFGPRAHDVVAVLVRDRDTGARIGEAFHFLAPLITPRDADGLSATAVQVPGGYDITIGATRVARAVSIEADGWGLSDNYFDVVPGPSRVIRARGGADGSKLRATLSALNASRPISVKVETRADP